MRDTDVDLATVESRLAARDWTGDPADTANSWADWGTEILQPPEVVGAVTHYQATSRTHYAVIEAEVGDVTDSVTFFSRDKVLTGETGNGVRIGGAGGMDWGQMILVRIGDI